MFAKKNRPIHRSFILIFFLIKFNFLKNNLLPSLKIRISLADDDVCGLYGPIFSLKESKIEPRFF